MPQRILQHGNAPTSSTTALPLEPGTWTDIPEQGQFLLDLEFLARHTHPEPRDKTKPTVIAESACVYTTSPPYLTEIARQFPWVHFFAFQHVFHSPDDDEYDPTRPAALMRITGPSYQTEHNRTMSCSEIDRASIVTLSRVKEDSPDTRKLVLICHGESSTRQLMLHAALRADYSMLDIPGPVPSQYARGEIVLPLQIRNNKAFASLIADQSHATAQYDPECYMDELCESQSAHAPHTTRLTCAARQRRLLSIHTTRERGVRPGQQRFNHSGLRRALLLVSPSRPSDHHDNPGRHSALHRQPVPPALKRVARAPIARRGGKEPPAELLGTITRVTRHLPITIKVARERS